MNKIGLIIGHGLNIDDKIEKRKEHFPDTPFGKPSARFITGMIGKNEVVVLNRHGKDGKMPAFKVNYKANMFLMHEFDCKHVFATSLCGSLQEEINTGEFIVLDQLINLTKHCELTFTDKLHFEKLNHSAFNKPFSDEIRDCFIEASVIKGYTIHTKCTVVSLDGPRQSTRAESNLFRQWGADVINITTTPEAILAHELGIAYGAISLCTYFDTWRTDIPPGTREEKQEVIENSAFKMQDILLTAIDKL